MLLFHILFSTISYLQIGFQTVNYSYILCYIAHYCFFTILFDEWAESPKEESDHHLIKTILWSMSRSGKSKFQNRVSFKWLLWESGASVVQKVRNATDRFQRQNSALNEDHNSLSAPFLRATGVILPLDKKKEIGFRQFWFQTANTPLVFEHGCKE